MKNKTPKQQTAAIVVCAHLCDSTKGTVRLSVAYSLKIHDKTRSFYKFMFAIVYKAYSASHNANYSQIANLSHNHTHTQAVQCFILFCPFVFEYFIVYLMHFFVCSK